MNTSALLSFPTGTESQSFTQLLETNTPLLLTHPLYLILLIFQERYRSWSEWFTSQWKVVADEIEPATGMTSKKWLAREPKSSSPPPPMDTKTLLERVHEAQAELSHVETVMKFAKRFGDVAAGVIKEFEDTRRELGCPVLSKRDLQELTMRMEHVISRCQAVDDRVSELRDRLKVQINVVSYFSSRRASRRAAMTDAGPHLTQVFGLIAQEDNKNSALIAEKQTLISQRMAEDNSTMRLIAGRQRLISERAADDSRVMKRIGLLTALFVPISLITVCLVPLALYTSAFPFRWMLFTNRNTTPEYLEHKSCQ